ncbi:MAG TPA: DUF4276 family protein [Gemmataceae bacterium]|nr:DUF4276 family protein [Gemmataceae bacterium]
MPLQIGVIVEGQGEYEAIRTLLVRIWYDLFHGDSLEVMRPFRQKQGLLRKQDGLRAAVDLVKIKLGPESPDGPRKLVLILMDAEKACPKELAPQLLQWAREARADADIACVLPCPMFETWLVAAASSLAGVSGLPAELTTPEDPEGQGLGKGWIKKRLSEKYNEPRHQPRFAARMNLALCRQNSPSFDKLCRELQQRLPPPPSPAS